MKNAMCHSIPSLKLSSENITWASCEQGKKTKQKIKHLKYIAGRVYKIVYLQFQTWFDAIFTLA